MTADLAGLAAVVPDAIVGGLRGARRVLAVSHENPDADTLGATLAVCRLAEWLGAAAQAVCTDPVPPLYGFLPAVERFLTDPEPSFAPDLLVVSDCGTLDRIGAVRGRHAALFETVPRLVIDHHASNGASGAGDWIDAGAAATCEMTALLAVRLGAPLALDEGALASSLMAGIVMDTATFAHPNTTPRTLAIAGALVEAGAPLAEIARRLYRSKPEAQLRLFGRILDRLEAVQGGLIVHSTLLTGDFAATGSLPAHGEGIIDLLSQADEAEVAILFKEADGATRISVRTKPGGVDATVLTGRFGGGGHARAAGATIDVPVAEARPVVLAEAAALATRVSR